MTRYVLYECALCGNCHPPQWDGDHHNAYIPAEYAEQLGVDEMDIKVLPDPGGGDPDIAPGQLGDGQRPPLEDIVPPGILKVVRQKNV